MASVKVAVRVRPFNQREIDGSSSAIIRMDGQKTAIVNTKRESIPTEDENNENIKEFTFDYSYWSFDSFDPGFASQQTLYNDLGSDVVIDAFKGYNCCIFAYGQTGSGKTYTMMGTPDSEGLIPRICRQLFAQMKSDRNCGSTFRTEVSYLEIYNETVKDLISKTNQKQCLRVREHPKLGPYVQGLSKHLVEDYTDLQELMNRGNAHRTTAATKMNDTSSRSHAIFTISFSMASFTGNTPRETMSRINLVDLAGNERVANTQAEGQRLVEGGHINKSLVTLGTVISALVDRSVSDKKKQTFIPYRNSVLTWLLRDSLGGNSKTIMIANISPADCNYGETLSTLRYANRAKNIINTPTINEDLNTKLIRELRSEIERLKTMLTDCPNALEKVYENEARVKALTEEWTEKWKETHKILKEQRTLGLRRSGFGIVLDSELPHLVTIDDDVLSTGITLYHLKEGKTYIGTEFAETKPDIVLHNAIDVEDDHCYFELMDGVATLVPINNANCYVNTIRIDRPQRLTQGCVIVLGENKMFRFNDPIEVERLRQEKEKGSVLSLSKIFNRSSDFNKSFESLDSSSEVDSLDNRITEKRRQIEELENEFKWSEELRKAQLLITDEELAEKGLELEKLKTESEKLRNIIEESKLILQNNDSLLNTCVESNEPKTISDMLSSMKHKTQDVKQRVSDVLSAITTNAKLNRKQSLSQNNLLLNIYETLTQQIQDMANEDIEQDIETQSNDKNNSNLVKMKFCDKNDNNISDLINKSIDAQKDDMKCISNCDNVCQKSIELKKQKVLPVLDSESNENICDNQSVIKTSCDLKPKIETNLIEMRLNELEMTFEKQFNELQQKFDSQRNDFECQRYNQMQTISDERNGLKELEEIRINSLVEYEVQKRLKEIYLDNSWPNDLDSEDSADKFSTSSPMGSTGFTSPGSYLSPSRPIYSISSLTDIMENSFETSEKSTQTPNGNNNGPNSIAISIPKYYLRGSAYNGYHEYEIQIELKGQFQWTACRRYSRFRELYNWVKHRYGSKVSSLEFPAKIWFENRNEKVVQFRQKALEQYLRQLIAIGQTIHDCPLNYKAQGLDCMSKKCFEDFSLFFHKECLEVSKQSVL